MRFASQLTLSPAEPLLRVPPSPRLRVESWQRMVDRVSLVPLSSGRLINKDNAS